MQTPAVIFNLPQTHRKPGRKKYENLEAPGSRGYEEPTLRLIGVIRNPRWFSVNLTKASIVLEGEPQLRKYFHLRACRQTYGGIFLTNS